MTLKIELIDPENEPPKTLKALAAFLNTMAGVEVTLGAVAETVAPQKLPAVEGNARPDAPGASPGSTPPPPPVAPAPDAQNIDSGDLDVNGLPWDARIHASTKGKNQDGSWKALRGVNKDIVPGIEAELRAALGNAASSETPPPPPVVANASTTAPAGAGDVPPPPPPPVQAPGADAPPPPPPVVDAAPEAPAGPTAATVFKLITELKKNNRLPQEQQDMALEMVGLKGLPEFMNLVKTKPELAQELLDAVNTVALPGGE